MRIVAFIVYLFVLLTSGGESLHATTNKGTHHSTTEHKIGNKPIVKFVVDDQSISILEDSDTDLEEDLENHDSVKRNATHLLVFGQTHFILQQNIAFVLKDSGELYLKRLKNTPPFCGFKSPLFITQRVLRI